MQPLDMTVRELAAVDAMLQLFEQVHGSFAAMRAAKCAFLTQNKENISPPGNRGGV